MRALFLADWCDVSFLHFRVRPDVLQPRVPFELDTFDGDAYVSLVAFTQRRLRPAFGGRIAASLISPIATHAFLNLRTYVKHRGERGIYFISEWIPNALASYLGPLTYGLPYRLADMNYRTTPDGVTNAVRAANGAIAFNGLFGSGALPSNELDQFLAERYIAFTHRHGISRRFAIVHEPWALRALNVERFENTLCRFGDSPALAHYSAGLRDVQISAPSLVTAPPSRTARAASATPSLQ